MRKNIIGFDADLHVREAEGDRESRTIEGYALKFNVRSKLLSDWYEHFYEVLEPGCVTREALDKQDIKLTMFHDRQLILGRSKEGKGTLSYEVDEVGVKFRAEMPRTADGDKALELVKRGDISGCSFAYATDEQDNVRCVTYEKLQEKDEKGRQLLLRHVKAIDKVFDFTLTPDPAYEQTSVSKREVEDAGCQLDEPQPPKIDEAKKREAIRAMRRLAE